MFTWLGSTQPDTNIHVCLLKVHVCLLKCTVFILLFFYFHWAQARYAWLHSAWCSIHKKKRKKKKKKKKTAYLFQDCLETPTISHGCMRWYAACPQSLPQISITGVFGLNPWRKFFHLHSCLWQVNGIDLKMTHPKNFLYSLTVTLNYCTCCWFKFSAVGVVFVTKSMIPCSCWKSFFGHEGKDLLVLSFWSLLRTLCRLLEFPYIQSVFSCP